MYVVTILAVIDDRYAVAAVREIGVLLRADLELRRVPAGVLVGRALDCAELDLVGRLV